MITSLFSKSKPINFLIVLLIAVFAFIISRITNKIETISFLFLGKLIIIFGIIYISILILNFIVSKNNLSLKNNYEILIYSLFLAILPQALSDINFITANFFILLAFRRIVSIRSKKEVSKKLYDAALWIAIASMFYFWAILFLLLIFVSLISYTSNNIKHWIIPLVGVVTVGVLVISFSIIKYNNFFTAFNFNYNLSFDFSVYNNLKHILGITIILSFGLWATVFYITKIKTVVKTLRPSFKLVLFWALIAIIIAVMSPIKNGGEFLFLFAPLSIITTNYIEMIKEKWFKEIFLSVLVILPIVLLLL